MKMGDGFPAIRPVVDHQTVAGFLDAQFGGQFGGFQQEMSQDLMVLWMGFSKTGNGLLGHDYHMHRRLRLDVSEGQHEIILINDVGRNLPSDHFLKKRFAHKVSFLV